MDFAAQHSTNSVGGQKSGLENRCAPCTTTTTQPERLTHNTRQTRREIESTSPFVAHMEMSKFIANKLVEREFGGAQRQMRAALINTRGCVSFD